MWRYVKIFKTNKSSSIPLTASEGVNTDGGGQTVESSSQQLTSAGSNDAQTISVKEFNEHKELIERALEASKQLIGLKVEGENAIRTIDRINGLVILGFMFMILALAGLCFGYWEYTHDTGKLSARINEIESQNLLLQYKHDSLKRCLRAGSWKGCIE